MTQPLAIPDDLSACQALVVELAKAVEEGAAREQTLLERNAEQKLAIDELMQRLFAKRSERYIEDPDQLKLDFGDTPEASDAAEGLSDAVVEQAEIIVDEHKRRKQAKKKPRREQLPEHLERYEVEAKASEDDMHCDTHGERKLIGHDRVETLEFQRPKLRVRVTLYPKYACPDEPFCGVASPPREEGLVEGNRYDTSVAAEIVTGKYGYHLPIYRQQDYFAGSGWTPGRSTLLNIQRASALLIVPLIQFFRDEVIASGVMGTDDTRVTLLLPPEIPEAQAGDPKSMRIHEVFTAARSEGKTSVSGRMWAYRSMTIPLNVFDFTVSRHRDGPDVFLEDYSGLLMADCYSGYQGIEFRTDSRILRGACGTHARRKVFNARESYPLESATLLAMFQELYDIEERARELAVADREALRQCEALRVWQRMEAWLAGPAAEKVLPKSDFGKALNYLRNHWSALQLYLSDGRLPIDNNEVEQLMKQVALGRKNWLFIGSVAAGERAADLLTLVSSAVRNDLDVWAYVKDVLDQLLAGSTDYASLRPDVWKAAHPEHVRTYRSEERRDRADAKRVRRARHRLEKQSAN
jgi:transposase